MSRIMIVDDDLVTLRGVWEDIPMKEFERLFKLGSFPGRTFARDLLIEGVWGEAGRGTVFEIFLPGLH